MDNKSKQGPHSVLIGGTKGLGRVLAELQSQQGYKVSVVARNAPTEPPASMPGVSFFQTDLLDKSSIEKTMKTIAQTRGLVDNLVFLQRSREPKGDPAEDWNNELDVALRASQTVIEALKDSFSKEKGGSIVFVSSMGGASFADSQPLEYGIAKAGINQMIKHYAVTLGSRQIRVNGVSCFTFLKDESKSHFLKNEALQKAIHQVVPMKRMATALDMAKTIHFFCSENASFVSGQVLVVDGGLAAVGQETVAFWATGVRERQV